MPTNAELRDRLDRLRMQRAGGRRAVQAGDERIEYRTDAELAAAIADLERQLADTEGRQVHTVLFTTSKGL